MSANLETVWQEVRKLSSSEQLELRERLTGEIQMAVAGESLSLWAEIDRIVQAAPPDAWESVPADGAANIDHYLYGAPKK